MITKTLRKTPDIFPLVKIRVIDGDTLEAGVCLPFDTLLMKRIRLKGWWAAELGSAWDAEARTAAKRLADFLEEKAVWLHAPSCRLDKYGRIIGTLMHGTRIISAREVLGELQLTEAEHKRRHDEAHGKRRGPQRTSAEREGLRVAPSTEKHDLDERGAMAPDTKWERDACGPVGCNVSPAA